VAFVIQSLQSVAKIGKVCTWVQAYIITWFTAAQYQDDWQYHEENFVALTSKI